MGQCVMISDDDNDDDNVGYSRSTRPATESSAITGKSFELRKHKQSGTIGDVIVDKEGNTDQFCTLQW